jgi:hypothetical protein
MAKRKILYTDPFDDRQMETPEKPPVGDRKSGKYNNQIEKKSRRLGELPRRDPKAH